MDFDFQALSKIRKSLRDKNKSSSSSGLSGSTSGLRGHSPGRAAQLGALGRSSSDALTPEQVKTFLQLQDPFVINVNVIAEGIA